MTLENLEKIEIGHTGTGFGAGWYIEKVIVKEKDGENTNMEYIFPCGMWLDDQIGDKLTCRTLELKGKRCNNAKCNQQPLLFYSLATCFLTWFVNTLVYSKGI